MWAASGWRLSGACCGARNVEDEAELGEFWQQLKARLEAGARHYGDASFRRQPAALAREIEEELLDVCGWAFVLWCRLRDLAGAMERKDLGIRNSQ